MLLGTRDSARCSTNWRRSRRDPGVVLVAILSCEELESRIVEAVPWIILRFEHLDWEWILREARARNVQTG